MLPLVHGKYCIHLSAHSALVQCMYSIREIDMARNIAYFVHICLEV